MRRLDAQDLDVLEDVSAVVGLALSVDCKCPTCDKPDDDLDFKGRHLARHLRAYLRQSSEPQRVARADEPVRANLAVIAKALGLGNVERDVLAFIIALHSDAGLKRMTERFGDVTLPRAAEIVAVAARLPTPKVLSALGPGGRLVQSGLIAVPADRNELASKFELKSELLDLISAPSLDREALLKTFVEPAPPSTLTAEDFAHVAGALTDLLALLQAASKSGARGINILLHGPTGTGKTELARLIAKLLGIPLHVAGRADDQGESATAPERLRSLLLANRIAIPGAALLLFDELEDLFRWQLNLFGPAQASAQMSKQWFNDLLENNPIPTLWITNRVEGIDNAFLRRFTFAVELRAPGPEQRAEVVLRHTGQALTREDAASIATRYDAGPAQIATAVKAASLIAPGGRPTREVVERFLAPVEKILRGVDPRAFARLDESRFRLDAIHCTEDLRGLADRLALWKKGEGPGVSICLHGRPGTGKSEYVKYLATRMKRRLITRRVSDIESMWVGETEKAIAQAFAEADAEDAVLLFDEVDSFLRDRSLAHQSWEATKVNEFLTQLESFRGVVACTTNLWRDLDEAALRRFVFKVEFKFLRPEQAMTLFQVFFPDAFASAQEGLIRGEISRMMNLTPGDFAAVSRRLRALGSSPGADSVISMLKAEIAVKRDAPRPVGF
jgi:SpoVK/Ycf46/Vps4 family AAA+-type ATPase